MLVEYDMLVDDKMLFYVQWDVFIVYGVNWGFFEIVSWKGYNYQVKWWFMGNQFDLNCGVGGVWIDFGVY